MTRDLAALEARRDELFALAWELDEELRHLSEPEPAPAPAPPAHRPPVRRDNPEERIVRAILLGTTDICLLARNVIITAAHPSGQGFTRGGYCNPGGADLLGLISACGHGLAVEVKTDRGRLSRDQVLFGGKWSRHRGIWICARKVDDVRRCVLAHVATCPAVHAMEASK